MDDINIAPIQRGDRLCGVWIPRTDVVGGQGGAISTPSPSKNKEKVVRVVHSDDKVSTDDDVPLQRQRWAAGSGISMTGGPPVAATTPQPDSSAVVHAMAPGGSDGNKGHYRERGYECSHNEEGRG
jgi:hypothetical protein